jgi:predicted PurR-regulated permease PerM
MLDPASTGLLPQRLVTAAAVSWRFLAAVAIFAAAGVALSLIPSAVAPLIVGSIVAATFAPYVASLRRRGWSPNRAAGTVTAAAALIILAALVLIALALVPTIGTIAANVEAGVQRALDAIDTTLVPDEVEALIRRIVDEATAWIRGQLLAIGGEVVGLAVTAILGGILTFYLLQGGDRAWQAALDWVPGAWRRQRLETAAADAVNRVGGYLRGTAILAGTDAISDLIFLWILGVPLSLAGPLAIAVFLGGFIPYIGGLITTTLLVIVTYTTVGLPQVVILLVLITIMNVIQGNLMAPVIYGRTIEIHPAVVLVALPAGAAIAGLFGLIIALPVAALIAAITSTALAVLGDDPENPRGALLLGSRGYPLWLDRIGQASVRLLILFATLVVAIYVITLVPTVTMPIVIALILASAFAPFAQRLRQRGWRPTAAAGVVTAAVSLFVIALIALAAIAIVGQLADVVAGAGDGAGDVDDAAGGVLGFLRALVEQFGVGIVAEVAAIVARIGTFLVILFLSALLMFYFLRDGERGWQKLLGWSAVLDRDAVDTAGRRASWVLSGYIIGTGIVALFDAVTLFVILTVLGIPLALPLAVLLFFGGFIPYVGAMLATGLALLVTLHYGGPTDVAILIAYTLVLNIVQGNVIAPLILGRSTGLHPAVVLLAIPAGADLAGIPGMFLAVPLLAVVVAVVRTFFRPPAAGPDVGSGPEVEPAPDGGPVSV